MKLCALAFLVLLVGLTPLAAKDIYVSAGSAGNGSQASPYSDISDALAMGAYAGDVIHVSEGVYYGEGGSGKWIIKTPGLTLVGGYTKDFSSRDPFRHRSILVRGVDPDNLIEGRTRGHDKKWGLSLTPTKASYNGNAMVSTEGEAKNVILDGFVIDGWTRLTYKKSGDLKTDIGPIASPLVSFNQPGCKVLNCLIVNSGGPGIRMGALGDKEKPDTWNEISNTVVVNTLMEAIDARVGNWDPDRNPDGGVLVLKNNTLAFVWSWLGEGYSLLIGRQTRLTVDGNLLAFASDFALNNGFGNDKTTLTNNVFFQNNGGVYRYFAKEGSGSTVVMDEPSKLAGKEAKKLYYLTEKSGGNLTANPGLKPDPAFFEKFTNQVKASGGGKVEWDAVNQWRSALGLPLMGSTGQGASNFAPIYEQDFLNLFSSQVKAGAQASGPFATYASAAAVAVTKAYVKIDAKDLKANLGKDVTVRIKLNKNPEGSGSFYVPEVKADAWVCYRSADMANFFYVKKGSEALDLMKEAIKNGAMVNLSGTLYDILATIKMAGKYGFVVDSAVLDD